MAVREFSLINEKGQKYSMMDIKNYCLLTEITGLGISYNIEYERVGNTYIVNSKILEQGKPSGIVNFKSYDRYFDFCNFINNSENIKLFYKIPFKTESKEYLRDVVIQMLNKSEIKTTGVISEPISFDCLSLWYEQNEIIFKIETYDDEMRYPYTWNSRYIDYNTRAIIFENKGHIEAPMQIEIDGFVQNPTISIFVDKQEYASIKVPITINEYEKLLYSSKTGEIYIQKQNTDGTKTNLWKQAYIDITKQNIFRLPLRSIRNQINRR